MSKAKKALLQELGQTHLFDGWGSKPSAADESRFYKQIEDLDASYPGGLKAYVDNGRKLLADSKAGVNPLEGWTPSVPVGETVAYGTPEFDEVEAAGMAAVSGGGCGFVLVAGGLGERLGYSGIKVQLPSQLTTGTTYLELYIRHILALQGSGAPLPLAIMTSGDTDAQTRALLDANANFGMRAGQVTIVRQEKVACLADNDARLAADPKDPYKLLTKPHGHGDVHYLLHSSGTLDAWLESGVQWVYFMQDTNAPSLKVLPAAIGISRRNQLDVNSVCVPRMPGESIGGLMALTHADGRTQTANVEYNQIDALLKATVEPRGDVADPATGRSPYPGSINQLLFALGPYTAQLHKTGGTMPEFVNPKYADASKTKFKSPTRLECMMQDYPKSLPPSARVGFSVISNTTAFSPVKTNLADARAKSAKGEPTYSAASGEADVYASACEVLAASGVRLPPPVHAIRDGVGVVDTPRVVIDPSFGPTLAAVRDKLPTPHAVSLAQGSTLVLEGDLTRVRLEALSLDGALVVRVVPGADVTIRNLRVSNKGWEFGGLTGGEPEELAIRGYKLRKLQTRELIFDQPGVYVVDDGPLGLPALVNSFSLLGVAVALAAALAGMVLLRRSP